MEIERVYLKGLENGKFVFNQIGDISLDNLDEIARCADISPICWIEVI